MLLAGSMPGGAVFPLPFGQRYGINNLSPKPSRPWCSREKERDLWACPWEGKSLSVHYSVPNTWHMTGASSPCTKGQLLPGGPGTRPRPALGSGTDTPAWKTCAQRDCGQAPTPPPPRHTHTHSITPRNRRKHREGAADTARAAREDVQGMGLVTLRKLEGSPQTFQSIKVSGHPRRGTPKERDTQSQHSQWGRWEGGSRQLSIEAMRPAELAGGWLAGVTVEVGCWARPKQRGHGFQ